MRRDIEEDGGRGEWDDGDVCREHQHEYALSLTSHPPSLPAISWTLSMKISGQPSRKRFH